MDEDGEDKQLPDERCINRNYIKESECSSTANTQGEALKIGNKNKYDDDNDESFGNLNKYYEEDNQNIYSRKNKNIFDNSYNEFNETIENNAYSKSILTNNTINDAIPPTPPPPLDDKFLKAININEQIPDVSTSPQPSVHEQHQTSSHSPILHTNIDREKRYSETDIGDCSPTRNIIIIDSNKNEKLDDNNFIFNNVVSKTNTIPSSPINPVSPDFFIGNSVFKPVVDMEMYRHEFNRKTKDKWYETIIPPNVPNNSRNIREGTTFDANIHGDELKNKNYYVTCPPDRDTPTYNASISYTKVGNTFESMDKPTSYDNTISHENYNIGYINENPTLLSCKRTYERRVTSRCYNQDSQGHFKKDWEVESYQTVKNEMPVSYNFYTRSAYK
uniref:Homeobox-containing protein n=1 Tax=Strongyloides papillosus TaxID=174720 RepID=A0A0N5BYQ4_STREA